MNVMHQLTLMELLGNVMITFPVSWDTLFVYVFGRYYNIKNKLYLQ